MRACSLLPRRLVDPNVSTDAGANVARGLQNENTRNYPDPLHASRRPAYPVCSRYSLYCDVLEK